MHSFYNTKFQQKDRDVSNNIDDTVRHMEDKVKNLGVIFDSRLSFEHHIKSLCSRLNGTPSYLNRAKNRILLINALIFSHLNYCSSYMVNVVKNCSMKYKNVSSCKSGKQWEVFKTRPRHPIITRLEMD